MNPMQPAFFLPRATILPSMIDGRQDGFYPTSGALSGK
jgi:hypothetical protein